MADLLEFVRSKIVQAAAIIGLVVAVLLKLRHEIRSDGAADALRELEQKDALNAKAIRERAEEAQRPKARPSGVPADAASGVRPEPTDTRGYRD